MSLLKKLWAEMKDAVKKKQRTAHTKECGTKYRGCSPECNF